MNIVVAQSGGPTSVINASLLGVFRQGVAEQAIDTVYGSLNGIEGIIHDRLVALNDRLATEEDMALLRQTQIQAPVSIGDVVLSDVFGTRIVITKDIP